MALDLVKLVGDQDHGDAAAGETANDLKQPFRLGIGQYRRRLIENKNSRASDQHLDDFHLLLLGDREISNPPFGIDIETELSRLFANVFANVLNSGTIRGPWIRQQDIFRNGEWLHQLEMLVNHANSATACVSRARQRHHFAIDGNGSGIRHVKARRDVHQR